MFLIHNIGKIKLTNNYNSVEEILACPGPFSFDGVYLNVWENRRRLASKLKGAILFVMGDYVGGDNTFDFGQPREKYCDWFQIFDLVHNFGCEIGWHTWSHHDLTVLSEEKLVREVTPPFPMKAFAYPYGTLDPRVEAAVRRAGYQEAYSVNQGDGSPFQLLRKYLNPV